MSEFFFTKPGDHLVLLFDPLPNRAGGLANYSRGLLFFANYFARAISCFNLAGLTKNAYFVCKACARARWVDFRDYLKLDSDARFVWPVGALG